MAKYSYEFKLQVVQAYLDGEGGYRYLSKKYGVPSKRDIEKWVFAYKAFGKDGLMRSRKNESYSFEFKLHVVELYLTTEVSYQELALSVGLGSFFPKKVTFFSFKPIESRVQAKLNLNLRF